MRNSTLEINLGYSNVAEVQLQAENVETGEIGPLPGSMMDKISRVILHLETGVKLDSDDAEIGIGAGKPFDHTIDNVNAKLALALGSVTPAQSLSGSYPTPHLAIYFTGTTGPVRCKMPAILITPAD